MHDPGAVAINGVHRERIRLDFQATSIAYCCCRWHNMGSIADSVFTRIYLFLAFVDFNTQSGGVFAFYSVTIVQGILIGPGQICCLTSLQAGRVPCLLLLVYNPHHHGLFYVDSAFSYLAPSIAFSDATSHLLSITCQEPLRISARLDAGPHNFFCYLSPSEE